MLFTTHVTAKCSLTKGPLSIQDVNTIQLIEKKVFKNRKRYAY